MVKKDLSIFFILTFFISWVLWIPMIFVGAENFFLRVGGTYGPLIAALLVTGKREKRSGVKTLLMPLLHWRVPIFWYLFTLFSTAIFTLLSIWIYQKSQHTSLVFNDIREIYLVIPVALYILVFSVLGEETGWRGYALPRLQHKYGALVASIIIGLIWGVWHLPLFFIDGNFHKLIPFWLFLVQEVSLSIVLTWIFNRTGGSLLLIHLFHTASNTTIGVLPILPSDTHDDTLPLFILCALLVLFSIIIVMSGGLSKTTIEVEN